ncbi:unnamed protein product [Fusarium fujikuroi]|nr:unnamed protein product [Fusarium fujikuroi]
MRSSFSQVATASILLASGVNSLAVTHPHSLRSDTPDESPLKIPGLPLPNATKSYWQDPPHRIANLRSTKDLPTEKTFDYVIIGSGISGAATAHKLLDRDSNLSILMIEARTAASGATGRNGGHCKPGDYNGVKAWVETYGEDDALRIANMEQDCVNDVRDFVRSHNVSSDFTDVETASLYWTDDSFKTAVESIEFQHELEKRRPNDVPKNKRTIWKGQDARDYWGWPEIVGAVTFKAHTQNPYHTVCGMLEYSLEKGLNLQTNTMALSLNQLGKKTKAGARWEVKTNRGTIKSKQVVLATNGFTPALHPGIASTNFTMPVRNQVSAVTPSANTTDNKVFRRSNSVPDLHSGNVYIAAQPPGAKNAGSVVIGGSTQMSPTRERYITDDTAINDQIAYVLHGAARTVYGYENWGGSTKVIQDWTGITFIVSVTGSPEDIQQSYTRIEAASKTLPFPLAIEVNLSCPNIPGAPPPAYGGAALEKYLDLLPSNPTLPVGIKTPPYTHHGQFATLIETLLPTVSSLSFITATNTLGSCLILENDKLDPQLPGTGVGGMAGPPLHPLALGNVSTLRKMLDQVPELSHIKIIGVGGVRDGDGYRRMRSVGAYAVAVGTGLGKQGPGVFERIERDLKGEWRVSLLKEKL